LRILLTIRSHRSKRDPNLLVRSWKIKLVISELSHPISGQTDKTKLGSESTSEVIFGPVLVTRINTASLGPEPINVELTTFPTDWKNTTIDGLSRGQKSTTVNQQLEEKFTLQAGCSRLRFLR
jgi:hypothetical protein